MTADTNTNAKTSEEELRGDGKRVLLVEDDANLCRLLTLTLSHKFPHHTVAGVHSGEEAIEKAATFEPDVVVIDRGLPDMSGLELAAHFKADSREEAPILICVSGRGEPKDLYESEDAGFDRHFVKPPDIRHLEASFHRNSLSEASSD